MKYDRGGVLKLKNEDFFHSFIGGFSMFITQDIARTFFVGETKEVGWKRKREGEDGDDMTAEREN